MTEMKMEEVSRAIARHEAWLQRNFSPKNEIQIEVNNVRMGSLSAIADISVTKMGSKVVYERSVYPYWMLQRYMMGKGGGYNVNQGGSA